MKAARRQTITDAAEQIVEVIWYEEWHSGGRVFSSKRYYWVQIISLIQIFSIFHNNLFCLIDRSVNFEAPFAVCLILNITIYSVSAFRQVISIDVRTNLLEGPGVYDYDGCRAEERPKATSKGLKITLNRIFSCKNILCHQGISKLDLKQCNVVVLK